MNRFGLGDDVDSAAVTAAAQAEAQKQGAAGMNAMATGNELSDTQAKGIITVAFTAAAIALGVPGAGQVAAALVVALFVEAAVIWKVMDWLGWQAGAGPGRCATDPPATGPDDPRWIHFSDIKDYGRTEWPPPQNSYEIWIRRMVIAYEELRANCRPAPVTDAALIQALTDLWNQTHDGPAKDYPPVPGWCRDNGAGGFACDDPLMFYSEGPTLHANMGKGNGQTFQIVGCTPSPFGFNQCPPPVATSSTAGTVAGSAAGVVAVAAITGLVVSYAKGKAASWAFEKAWSWIKRQF